MQILGETEDEIGVILSNREMTALAVLVGHCAIQGKGCIFEKELEDIWQRVENYYVPCRLRLDDVKNCTGIIIEKF